MVDALARDGRALLAVLDDAELTAAQDQAARLLATVLGQDLESGVDGVFRIARRVAKDRVISTVDPQARHGHKTAARGFDGYKGHVAADPDSEVITATTVTAGNVGDAAAATDLLREDLPAPTKPARSAEQEPTGPVEQGPVETAGETEPVVGAEPVEQEPLAVYGDAADGSGELLDELENAGAQIGTKVQPPSAPGGRFAKDQFDIDLNAGTVGCPNGYTARTGRTRSVAGPPRSERPVRGVRWPRSAPPPGPAAPSRSAGMRSG